LLREDASQSVGQRSEEEEQLSGGEGLLLREDASQSVRPRSEEEEQLSGEGVLSPVEIADSPKYAQQLVERRFAEKD
jgi:hypothetical protein